MSGKEHSWKPRILFCALAVLYLSGKQLYGQSSSAFTATLSGGVIDPAGAAINGAKLTLTSPEIGFSRTYSTKDTGLYTFTFLPPAVYTLEVEAPGFKHYKQVGITLAAGQTAEQQVKLTVGAVTQEVYSHCTSAARQYRQRQYFGGPIVQIRRRPPFELSKRNQPDAD